MRNTGMGEGGGGGSRGETVILKKDNYKGEAVFGSSVLVRA